MTLGRRASDATTTTKLSESATVLSQLQIPSAMSPNFVSSGGKESLHFCDGDGDAAPVPTVGKQLWKKAIRNVKIHNAMVGDKVFSAALSPAGASFSETVVDSPQSSNNELPKPIRKRTTSSGLGKNMPERRRTIEQPLTARSKMNILTSRLTELVVKHDLAPHTALVRHMQFSPDGRYLATASWDKTSVIFQVGVGVSMLFCVQNLLFVFEAALHIPPYIGTCSRLCGTNCMVWIFADFKEGRLTLGDGLGPHRVKFF